MIFRVFYTAGNTAELLKTILMEEFKTIDTHETQVAQIPHVMFTMRFPSDLPSDAIELNSAEAIQLAETRSLSAGILKCNHIHTVKDEESRMGILREYRVFLVNLNAVRLYKRDDQKAGGSSAGGWQTLRADENNKELKKVIQTARTALQSLGLDFGLVHLVINRYGRMIVIHLEPSPVLTLKAARETVRIWKQFVEAPYPDSEITLGADPEFLISSKETGKQVMASYLFPRQGIVGCDSIRVPNREERPIAEVRPEPTPCPLELTDNVEKTLIEAIKLAPYRNVRFQAGSQPVGAFPIGGHIHFGGIRLSSKLLRSLDNYLAIPIMMLEDSKSGVKRRAKYGLLSDFRTKEYGGFEYRTLPSWLISPEYARGVLCLAYIIIHNYTRLITNYLSTPGAQEAFYTGRKQYFSNIINHIWEQIKQLPEASTYAQFLDPIRQASTAMTSWDESVDLHETWNLPSVRKTYRASSVVKKQPPARMSVRVRSTR